MATLKGISTKQAEASNLCATAHTCITLGLALVDSEDRFTGASSLMAAEEADDVCTRNAAALCCLYMEGGGLTKLWGGSSSLSDRTSHPVLVLITANLRAYKSSLSDLERSEGRESWLWIK